MNPIKTLLIVPICFVFSACASAVSRQHIFEVVGSNTIRSNCRIDQVNRRAVVAQKEGKLYIVVQNSSRITWFGLPFIPFIPTFIEGNKLNSLRLDVKFETNGNSSPFTSLQGWILHLDDQNVEGKVKIYEYDQQYSASVNFDFPAIDAKSIAVTIPSSQGNRDSVKLILRRYLAKQYFPFAFGFTHYHSKPCPEDPRQAIPQTPGI